MVLVLPQNRSTVADIHSSRSFFHSYHDHRDLPSFPTRRSSDLLRHSLGSAQRVEATLLYSIQRQQLEDQVTSVTGLPYEQQQFYDLGSAGRILGVSSNLTDWKLQSYMARVNYALKDRYLLTLTSRLDGSSRLAPG